MAKEERRYILDIETSVVYLMNFDADSDKVLGVRRASQGSIVPSPNAGGFGGGQPPNPQDEMPFGQTMYGIDPTGDRPFELYTVVWPTKEQMDAGEMPHVATSNLPRDMIKAGLATYPKSLRPENPLDVENETELKQAMSTINELVGLKNVKEALNKNIAMARFGRAKERAFGKPGKGNKHTGPSLHLVFTGNPGTGKTTVAREYAKVLHALGFIRKPEVLEVQRTDLVAEFVGQTGPKTRKVLQKAKGGVLFIDEAYALTLTSSDKDFGKEAIAELVATMENNRDDLVVIVAGYSDPMKTFINANEGLKSRFLNYISFEDYTKPELSDIMDFMLKQRGYTMEPEAHARAVELLDQDRVASGNSFGNGRSVRNLVDKAEQNLALRLDREGKLKKDNGLTQDEMKGHLTMMTLDDINKADLAGFRSISNPNGANGKPFGFSTKKPNDGVVPFKPVRPNNPMIEETPRPKTLEDDIASAPAPARNAFRKTNRGPGL